MSLRTIPIHRCGNRPSLFMGGDRELVMFSGLLSTILIFAAQDWLAAFVGIFMWFSALKGLRLMAKSDPSMRAIYLRQRCYQAYYPARSTPFRTNRRGYQ
ncbi:TPA: conjugal transfer protein TrbD [Legionella pneumophila]|nr:conjugal transfer protein TrbD [Legionella pneumophila]HAT5916136.1 conjugal transfer protein TrbD [Legionella pneumophila]HAT7773730.1 conjugal transfer protein TrbD [Legionella pneumophila]HAT7825305.1 conjugal transfer protein TrbD [Legionella pneumophila]HAT7918642.1 conjugal transfer protein TrbD [Legionella pneumophila]